MLALGESGRFEFKRDADAIKPGTLAALANWVALDGTRDVAHLLVGVDEVEDKTTGLVYGKPVGLPKGLDRSVARIQDMARMTHPIPVDAFVIEEAVAEAVPFIRVEIRPTMPPHFDDEGRRQTRQGRSTRALTDDELLRIYLDREAGSFGIRFRQAGEELQQAVGAVGAQVDDIADAIEQQITQPLAELSDTAERAATAADDAEAAAMNVEYEVSNVGSMVRDLRELVEELQDNALETLAARVVRERRRVWWAFTDDTWERTSMRAERLATSLRTVLSHDISLDSAKNTWELRIWANVLKDRKQQRAAKGTLKWWGEIVAEVEAFIASPAYSPPDLPDLRAELRADFDRALDDPNSETQKFARLLDR